MMKKHIPFLSSILTIWLIATTVLSVNASQFSQGFVTPTPGADGRITMVVQEGQNCTIISTITGVPVSQIRSLNRLDENCTLQVGQELLIGMVEVQSAASATPDPAKATPIPLATPTPELGSASICVLLYDDVNGDALHQDTEGVIEKGAVSVTGTSGQYSRTATTTNSVDPICFDSVLSGTYNISVAAPEGYNPTTQQNFTIDVKIGEQIYVDFGSQIRSEVQQATPDAESNPINIFGILGGILVVLSIGLAVYAFFFYRKQ
jgi:hypothetical protein